MPKLKLSFAEIVRLYTEETRSLKYIGKVSGHHPLTIRKILVLNGVEIRPRASGRKRTSPVIPFDAEIAEKYQGGMTIAEIARELHWSYDAIRSSLVRSGIQRRRRGARMPNVKVSHEEYQRTIELYLSGLDAPVVGQILGISASAVYDRLKYSGVPRRNGRDSTRCPSGHDYTDENTRYDTKGHRICRTCDAINKSKYRNRLRANSRSDQASLEDQAA